MAQVKIPLHTALAKKMSLERHSLGKGHSPALLRTLSDHSLLGYLLDSSLCDCVGRLRVFEQLEDLLESLLIWLPLHPRGRGGKKKTGDKKNK